MSLVGSFVATLCTSLLAACGAYIVAIVIHVLFIGFEVGSGWRVDVVLYVALLALVELGYSLVVLLAVPVAICLGVLAFSLGTRFRASIALNLGSAVTLSAVVCYLIYPMHVFEWLTAPCADADCSRPTYFDWAQTCLHDLTPRWCASTIDNQPDGGAPIRAAAIISASFGLSLGLIFWLIRRPDRDVRA